MFLHLRRLSVILAFCLGIIPCYAEDVPAEQADDGTVWAGVFLGSASTSSLGLEASTPESLSVITRMRKLPSLSFPHYRLLGEHVQPLLKEYESWLVPSRGFFFKMDSRGPEPSGGVRIAVQLWRDKEVLVKTDVVLQGERPVIMRGPALGTEGTLLVALRLTTQK